VDAPDDETAAPEEKPPPRTPSPVDPGLPTPEPTPDQPPNISPEGWKSFSDFINSAGSALTPYYTAKLADTARINIQYLLSARTPIPSVRWRSPWGTDTSWHDETEADMPPALVPALRKVTELRSHMYITFDWDRVPLLDGLDFDRSAVASTFNPA